MNKADWEQAHERFLRVATANVADVLDGLGFPNQGLAADFRPLGVEDGRLAGWAHTIQGEPATYPLEGGDPAKMEACAALTPGSVSVWARAPSEQICFFGELIAVGMKERGCVGALVDGGVRDVEWLRHHRFSVFARYRTPIQSIGRWRVVDHGCPVQLPGATLESVEIRSGDLILADPDGAIVVPASLVDEVLPEAERLTATEEEIRRELTEGAMLSTVLAKFGHV